MANIGEIIAKRIEMRDRKAELAKKHAEEMAPLNEAEQVIDNYLMHTMNQLGVDQLKENGVGTVFKKNATSVQMADPLAFKHFVFSPVAEGILNYLQNTGYALTVLDKEQLQNILLTMPMWDMIDFRAGKKGITEFIANENTSVPGVAINTIATVNIRRA